MLAATFLARANAVDSTVSNLSAVLVCAGIALAVGVVTMAPVMIAWSRRHRHTRGLAALAVLWGVLAAISVSAAALDRMKYSRDHLTAIESGYYDPNDTSDAPSLPVPAWTALGIGYAALLAWPLISGKPSPAPLPPPGENRKT
jgi:hypothetical protein